MKNVIKVFIIIFVLVFIVFNVIDVALAPGHVINWTGNLFTATLIGIFFGFFEYLSQQDED